ncbi:MAG: stress-responsive transcription factor hsf1 [Cirrosporium novae-zelandiae]|nr:MAG: stress-responsive transcription factor hsf1 [Cirrosporium novae-zelandiae]
MSRQQNIQSPPRKRPAPGAPSTSQPSKRNRAMIDPSMESPQLANQFLRTWDPNTQNLSPSYPDPTVAFSPNAYTAMGAPTPMPQPVASNQIALRTPSQQLVPRGRSYNDADWGNTPINGNMDPRHGWDQSIEDLQQRAMIAKREAQAKRKSIPPFVQKLSSFLDKSENTDLIRWSDSGDSFIVLDEDEFARTLIPELFKHNNYASFVRQLNMYGFHKKVGLSDNSMRASERKNKAPSEYSNPYFRRYHPELLWLIQKPKNASGQGKGNKGGNRQRAEEGDQEEDQGDESYNADSPAGGGTDGSRPRNLLIGSQNGYAQDQLASIHRELQAIRQQQQVISGAITRLRKEHEQLYSQAAAFQSLHDKHQNSINAILTFLATIYHKSLEGPHADNIANMFSTGSVSEDHGSQGNVIDDYHRFQEVNSDGNQMGSLYKKQPLMIQAAPEITPKPESVTGRASTTSPAVTPATPYSDQPRPRPSLAQSQANVFRSPKPSASPQMGQHPLPSQINSNTSTQTYGQASEQDILAMIKNTNSQNSTVPQDFNQALSSLQTSDGNHPLTPTQRNTMLKLMANDAVSPGTTASELYNSLTSPAPSPAQLDHTMVKTRAEIDKLCQLQRSQANKMQNLINVLGPLSPNGSIPGFDMEGTGYFGNAASTGMGENPVIAPTDIDQLSQFLNLDDSVSGTNFVDFSTPAFDTNTPTFNFDDLNTNNPSNNDSGAMDTDLLNTGGDLNSRIVETNSSTASSGTSPAPSMLDAGRGGAV